MNNPVRFSINNRLFINVLSIIIVLVGVLTIFSIRRSAFPNVTFDRVQVTTTYQGATPKEVEKLVTIPLEEEIDEVDGIDEIDSVSAENTSVISIKIDPDEENKDKVVNDIQRAVDRVNDLPQDADDPIVLELETKNEPILTVSLSSNSMTELEIRKWALILEDILLDIPDIASVSRSGFRDPEIWVEVDPKKLEPYYLSLEEVIEALQRKNITLAGGTIVSENTDFTVRTLGEFEKPEEIEEIVIRANDQGKWIKIRDVAKVRLTLEEPSLALRTNGRNALNLVVIKKQSGDVLKMVKGVMKAIDSFGKQAPPELKINKVNDFSYFVQRRLNILITNGLIGGVFITILLFLFMRISIAITTLTDLIIVGMGALIATAVLGIDINLISMFGFIMVLGMLCDDTIVVSENFYRLLESGDSPPEAAVKGAVQVFRPVLTTVATTVVVFMPLMFMPGIIGKFIHQIPIVVIAALGVSIIECFLILPGHLSHWVRAKAFSKKEKREEHWFEVLKLNYEKVLKAVLVHKYKTVVFVTGIFFGSILLAWFGVKFVLFSSEGIEQFFLLAEAPIGTSLEHTKKLLEPIEKAVSELPENELEDFISLIGMTQQEPSDPFTARGSHLSQIQVFLTPTSSRDRPAQTIINEIREKIKDAPGFERVYFDKIRPGPPVGKPITVQIVGEEYSVLNEIADKFIKKLESLKGVSDIRSDYELGKEELRVIVDEPKAAEAGLTVGEIAEGVRNAYEGGIATTIKTTEEEIDVRVKWLGGKYLPKESLETVLIRNKFDLLVPLHRVAKIQKGRGLSAIKHFDRDRVVSVTANVDDEAITSGGANKILKKTFEALPQEYPGYQIKYEGEAKDSQESMQALMKAFLLALLFVFLILVLQFKSISQPLVVMSTIPLCIIGVILAFFVHHKSLGFMSILGIVGLSGVVVNNSVIMLTFINNLRQKGEELKTAIIEGCKLRLRAIIITSLTTAAGTFPMAYGIGGNDPFIRPLALAFTWGLLLSTFLTLIVVPCLFAITEDLKEKIKHKLHVGGSN